MKKLLKRILILILIISLVIIGFFTYKGYIRYRNAVVKTSISVKVKEYTDKEDYAEYDEIDKDFINAVVAIEDKRFFSRKGLDFIAFTRALLTNIISGKLVEGGSTISQQIAKNIYFQDINRSITGKIAEVFVMIDLENAYSKEEIFALYVNMNYYGDGYWGITQAAKGYYQTSPNDLTVAQAAMLAGIPNAPAVYQLSTGHDLAYQRALKVLKKMLENYYITQAEYEAALKEDI